MAKTPFLLICLGLLTACTDGGTPSAGYIRPGNFQPGRVPYVNAAKNSNNNLTKMTITNGAQASDFVENALEDYTGNRNYDNLDIASMAIQIASDPSGYDYAAADIDTLNPALYLLSTDLYSKCGGTADATCIKNWCTNHSSTVKTRLNTLYEWAQPIDISNAAFLSTADTTLTFTVNEAGAIDSISVTGAAEEQEPGTTEPTMVTTVYERIGNNIFESSDGDILTYNSGTTNNFRLSYSDFGMYNIVSDDKTGNLIAFAGGYNDPEHKIADITTVTDTLDFSGKAVGVVYDGSDNLDLNSGEAFLTFNKNDGNPTTELKTTFSNWYTVKVTQTNDGTTIGFTKNPNDTFDLNPNAEQNGDVNMNIGYYGLNGIPTEAVGTVQYKETDGIQMEIAFGVK